MREDFIASIDFGKRRDNAAMTLIQRTPLAVPPAEDPNEEPEDDPLFLRIVYCRLAPLRTRYHDLAQFAVAWATHPKMTGRIQLAVDAGGVGEAALEIFEEQPALADILWPIVSTAGQRTHKEKNTLRHTVPKKDLIGAVKVALQRERLACNPLDAPDMDALRLQLFAFKMKVRENARVVMEAQTESDHDDLVMSLAQGVWLSDQIPLEEYFDYSGAGTPHILMDGPQEIIGRPAPSWRAGDVIQPAGTPPVDYH